MLGSLIKTILLVVNAVAILNDKRFIQKYLGSSVMPTGIAPESPTNTNQLVMLVLTLRTYGIYLLIPLNIITILMELFS